MRGWKREEIRIRDPFVLTDKENGCYYLYGSPCPAGADPTDRLYAYRSEDLSLFEGPYVIFDGAEQGFWATYDYWAPEVHKSGDTYYLFCSFKAEGRCRGTQILSSPSPLGPFRPISAAPQTPPGWECLDGTLYTENGTPYLVFCHEWLQCGVGEIWAVPLKADFSAAAGEPFLLFKASDHPEVTPIESGGCRGMVTDGPFLFREEGGVKMLWSSFIEGRYALLEAVAEGIRGKWTHLKSRFPFDGGHGMRFEDLGGKKLLAMHSPNRAPLERLVLLPYEK